MVWAVLLAGGLVVVVTPPVQGAPAETREVVVKPREPRPDVFYLAGRVRPDYALKPAVLQRRNCGDCSWFAFERFRTDARSRFRLSVPDLEPGRSKVCYRVRVPGGKGFEEAVSETNCLGPVT